MKNKSKKIFTAAAVAVLTVVGGSILAYLIYSTLVKHNDITIGEASEKTIFHRIYATDNDGNITGNLVFDNDSSVREFAGNKFYLDYYDGYTTTDDEIASKHTIPNGFFLNSYQYRTGAEDFKDYKFINTPEKYVDKYDLDDDGNVKTPELTYPRKLQGKTIAEYEVGKNADGADYTQGGEITMSGDGMDIYYDYQPIKYKITYDMNADFMDGVEGYPTILAENRTAIEKKRNAITTAPSGGSESEKVEKYKDKDSYRYYYSTYDVFNGTAFPDAKWMNPGGIEYIFDGWKIVSDDHYDSKTDEYTNFNYKEKQEYVYETDEHGSYKLDENGDKILVYKKDENGNYVLDENENKIPLTKTVVDDGERAYGINYWVSTDEDNAFTKIKDKDGTFHYFASYKGGDDTTAYANMPTEWITKTTVKDSQNGDVTLYTTAEVLALLNARSTGNIVVQAQWSIPKLEITYDTSYIQASFDDENGSNYTNTVKYEYDVNKMKYVAYEGEYKEPMFKFQASYRGEGDKELLSGTIKNTPYIQFWSTDTRLKSGSEYNGDIVQNVVKTGVSDDYLQFKENLSNSEDKHDARDGMVVLANGKTKKIEEAINDYDYPDKAHFEEFYEFIKNPVYKDLNHVDISALKQLKDNIDFTESVVDGKTVYKLTVYGYIRPMMILQSSNGLTKNSDDAEGKIANDGKAKVTFKEFTDDYGDKYVKTADGVYPYEYLDGDRFSYGNRRVEFDYIAQSNVIGNNPTIERVLYKDDFINNRYDPRIWEKQTGEKGWIQDGSAIKKSFARGKQFILPTRSRTYKDENKKEITEYLRFEGWYLIMTDDGGHKIKEGGNESSVYSIDTWVYDDNTGAIHDIENFQDYYGKVENGFIDANSHGGNYDIVSGKQHYYHIKGLNTNKIFIRSKWSRKNDALTLTIDPNGAKNADNGDYKPQTYKFDISDLEKLLPGNTFNWDGYVFKGWTTTKDDKTTFVEKLSDVTTSGGGSKTVYAYWEKAGITVKYLPNTPEGYTVKYNGVETTDGTTQLIPTSSTVKSGLLSVPNVAIDRIINVGNQGTLKFVGWNTQPDGTGDFYVNGQVIRETDSNINSKKELTLYAMFSGQSITFDANGGTFGEGATNETSNIVFYANRRPAGTYDSSRKGVYVVPTREGYAFDGWIRENTTTKVTDINNDTGVLDKPISTSGYAGKKFYAAWKQIDVPVYFNPNGGSGSITAERLNLENGGNIKLKTLEMLEQMRPAQGFSREGYVFAGWTITPEAEEVLIEDGGELDYNAVLAEYKKLLGQNDISLNSITLYAKWATQQTVEFNANGGTGEYSEKTDNHGWLTIPTVDKTGITNGRYVFLGWSDTKDAWKNSDAKIYKVGEKYRFFKPTKIYAQWYYYGEDFSERDEAAEYKDDHYTILDGDGVTLSITGGKLKVGNTGSGARNADIEFNSKTATSDIDYTSPYILEANVNFAATGDHANLFAFSTSKFTAAGQKIDIEKCIFRMESEAGSKTKFKINNGTESIDIGEGEHNIKVVVSGTRTYAYIDGVLFDDSYTVAEGTKPHGICVSPSRNTSNVTTEVYIDDIKAYSMEPVTTVTFKPNGGAGSEETVEVFFEPYKIPECMFEASSADVEFYSWNTAADGKGTKYEPEESIDGEELKSLSELYAIWDKVYRIDYQTLGGTGDLAEFKKSAAELEDITVIDLDGNDGKLTKKGYKLSGWLKEEDSEEEPFFTITKEDFLKLAQEQGSTNVKLYAKWEESALKATYIDPRPDAEEPQIDDLTEDKYKETYTLKADNTFTYDDNHLIVGWRDTTTNEIYPPGFKINTPTQSVTYEAVWGKKSEQLSNTTNWVSNTKNQNITKSNVSNNGVELKNTNSGSRTAYIDFENIYPDNWNDVKKAYTLETDITILHKVANNDNRQIALYLEGDSVVPAASDSAAVIAEGNYAYDIHRGAEAGSYEYAATNGVNTINITKDKEKTISIKAIVDSEKIVYTIKYDSTVVTMQKNAGEAVKGLYVTIPKDSSYYRFTNTYIYSPEKPSVAVTYDPNGAMIGKSTTKTYYADSDIATVVTDEDDIEFINPGYEFVGWTANNEVGQKILDDDKIVVPTSGTATTTLTANWKMKKVVKEETFDVSSVNAVSMSRGAGVDLDGAQDDAGKDAYAMITDGMLTQNNNAKNAYRHSYLPLNLAKALNANSTVKFDVRMKASTRTGAAKMQLALVSNAVAIGNTTPSVDRNTNNIIFDLYNETNGTSYMVYPNNDDVTLNATDIYTVAVTVDGSNVKWYIADKTGNKIGEGNNSSANGYPVGFYIKTGQDYSQIWLDNIYVFDNTQDEPEKYVVKFNDSTLADVKFSDKDGTAELPYYNTDGFYGWETEDRTILLPGVYDVSTLAGYDRNSDKNVTLYAKTIAGKMSNIADGTLEASWNNAKKYNNVMFNTGSAIQEISYMFNKTNKGSNILNDDVAYYVIDLVAYMGAPRYNANTHVPNTVYIGADSTGSNYILAFDSELLTTGINGSIDKIETEVTIKDTSDNNTFVISNTGSGAEAARIDPAEVNFKIIVDTEAGKVYYNVIYGSAVVARGTVNGSDLKNLKGIYTKLPQYAMFGIKSVDVYAIDKENDVLTALDVYAQSIVAENATETTTQTVVKANISAIGGGSAVADVVAAPAAIAEVEESTTEVTTVTEAVTETSTETFTEVPDAESAGASSEETVITADESDVPAEEIPKTEPEEIEAVPVKKESEDENDPTDEDQPSEVTEEEPEEQAEEIFEDDEVIENIEEEAGGDESSEEFNVTEFIDAILNEDNE